MQSSDRCGLSCHDKTRDLYFDQNPGGILEQVFQAFEPGDGFAAVDEAMVVGESDVHHRANDDVAFASDGPVLDGVQAEDATLRRVYDGGGEQGTVDTAVADGEGAALEFFEFQFVIARAFAEVGDGEFDFGEAHAFGVAEDRHDEAFAAADGDTDIEEIVIDNISTTNFGIERRELFEGLDASLHEERHEAELDVVLLLEGLAVFFAQGHDVAHVDFVEGGEQRGGVLGLDEALGHGTTQAAHGNDFLLPVRGWS